jgi:hypothetical protein
MARLAIQAIAEFVTTANVGFVVREGDLCLLAVDNHPTRALVDRHIAGLTEVTLISGGNDETDGNVQLVRRRAGYSVDRHLTTRLAAARGSASRGARRKGSVGSTGAHRSRGGAMRRSPASLPHGLCYRI